MAISNSPLVGAYGNLLSLPGEIRLGALELAKPLRLWIDDGLMAVFFLLVGLEVKREVMQGELSTVSQITLPLAAAIGGMVVPAGIYVWLNMRNAVALSKAKFTRRPSGVSFSTSGMTGKVDWTSATYLRSSKLRPPNSTVADRPQAVFRPMSVLRSDFRAS